MILKGVSDIRSMHDVHTKPGPLKESDALLELYNLAQEKDLLLKKLQWVRQQNDQTEKRLSDIVHRINMIEKRRISTPTSHIEVPHMSIKY